MASGDFDFALFDSLLPAPFGLALFDEQLRFVRVNEWMARFAGKDITDFPGRTLDEMLPNVTERMAASLRQALERGEPSMEVHRGAAPTTPGVEGSWLASFHPMRTGGVACVIIEMSVLAQAEASLRDSEQINRTVLEALDEGIVIEDAAGRVLLWNTNALRMLHITPEALRERGVTAALRPVHEDGTALQPAEAPGLQTRTTGEPVHGMVIGIELEDGGRRWLQITSSPLETGGGRGVVSSFTDITDRREAEALLVHRSLHDGLTGLPNRTLLSDRLGHALARSRREGTVVAVLFCDLDRFKHINDSFGHEAGDELLVEVARRFQTVLRPNDTVARLGGDEYVVVCEGLAEGASARQVAARLHEVLRRPVELRAGTVHVSVSIGISAGAGTAEPGALLRNADAAMYLAKERGRSRTEEFREALRARALERLRLEAELRAALEAGRLRPYYQRIVSLDGGHQVGAEALLRWEHPEHGTLAPGSFLDIAEDSGLIVPIGAAVLAAACRESVRRRTAGGTAAVSVNISATQVDKAGFADAVADVLDDTGVHAEDISLELTENALVRGGAAAFDRLYRLKTLGIRLGLDDFGTGYSSLTHLQRFPLDFVKIDRSFVAGLGLREGDTAIVQAIITLARTLGLVAIAEGVETMAQAERLADLGCHAAQGFLYGVPEPPEP